MNKKISIIFSLALIIIIQLFYSCRRELPPAHPPAIDSIKVDPFVISKVNFYFENSASMNGYLTGTNFKQTMHRILGNIEEEKLNSFFVNSAEYKVDNILTLIDDRNISKGDVGTSDHQFIFTNAIQNVGPDELGMVVTDGIYSVKDGDIDVVGTDIENTFKKALQKNEIETVVLKLVSEFDGTYYSETCPPGEKAIKIKQDRPYYILLFGGKKAINRALENIAVTQDLPGFKDQARFLLTQYDSLKYSILTLGEEVHGKFRKQNKKDVFVQEIKDAQKFTIKGFRNTPKDSIFLQFGIAIDFSEIELPDSYLTSKLNYKINKETGFTLEDIKVIDNLSAKSKTKKFLDSKFKKQFTHILVVKAKDNLYGDLIIKLENNLPEWINNTGTSNDCPITDDTQGTFAFDSLMKGISEAYKKINNNEAYFGIELKINP